MTHTLAFLLGAALAIAVCHLTNRQTPHEPTPQQRRQRIEDLTQQLAEARSVSQSQFPVDNSWADE